MYGDIIEAFTIEYIGIIIGVEFRSWPRISSTEGL